MSLFRSVVVGLCVAAAGLVVSVGPANATPTPVQPPTVTKSFTPSTIPLNGTGDMLVSVSNPNATTSLTGVNLVDTMPAGVVIRSAFTGPLCDGVVVVTANSVSMTGLTIPPGMACSTSDVIQGTTVGTKVNTAIATSTNGGSGAPATATLVVLPPLPPTLAKSFSPDNVRVGDTTTLTFTLTNPNLVGLSRITFADPFPPGIAVAANPGVVNGCGGVPSVGPYALAVAYANANLPPGGSCTFSVNVTAGSPGTKTNTTTIVSSSAGIGSPATGTLTVREL
jgi:uncharacterized repeat protein (TIGR01451 family)